MAVNKRQSEILKILYQKEGYMTFTELADQLQVSVKTVRNDVSSLKEELSGRGEIETVPHVGIRLVGDETVWNSLVREEEEDREIFFFILRRLLKNGSLTAQSLAERYYMGRTQLEKLLETVDQWFFEHRICFERRRGKGISIRCSEFNYRLARLSCYREFIPFYETMANVSGAQYAFLPEHEYRAMCAALDGLNPDRAAKALIDTEQEFGFSFNYESGANLLFLSALSVVRIKREHEVDLQPPVQCPTDGESGRRFADRLADRLEEEYRISFSEQERKFLTFAVDVSEIREFDTEQARRGFEAMNVELCRFTVRAVHLVSEIAGVELREDRFFVKQMLLQMKVTISRLQYALPGKNQLLDQIKDKYPNMMAVAWFLENLFEKELGLELNEHEVGFLALLIGGGIGRKLSAVSACIVCDYGIGIAQILRERIARAIPDLQITAVFSGRDVQRMKQDSCDFIISATSLEGYRMDRDMITIGHLLEVGDIQKIENEMRKIRSEKKIGVQRIMPHIELFSREVIFPQWSCSDKRRLLHEMCQRLESLGYVTPDFEASVLEREKSAPTDLGKGFALPHGLRDYVNHSVVAVATLQKSLEWTKNARVDVVFLIAFDPEEDEQVTERMMGFYRSIVSFMEDDAACDKLRHMEEPRDLIQLLEQW